VRVVRGGESDQYFTLTPVSAINTTGYTSGEGGESQYHIIY
jgi:hypothetical protein